ncbi:unnamed protein product, partial [Rotaria sp. Silwood1]
MLDDSAGNP